MEKDVLSTSENTDMTSLIEDSLKELKVSRDKSKEDASQEEQQAEEER